MADISPKASVPTSGVTLHTWENVTENDTPVGIKITGAGTVLMAYQVTGTFNSATVVIQGSNDGVNWVNLNDILGNQISVSAAGGGEISSSFVYLRPSISGGTSQDITVSVATRG